MKFAILGVLFAAALGAQDLSFVIHDPTGQTADQSLGSAYAFPNVSIGNAGQVVLRVSNTTNSPIQLNSIYFASNTAVFTVGGTFNNFVLAASAANFEEFSVYFSPNAAGPISANLQVEYTTQVTTAKTETTPISTFSGAGTPAVLTATYALGTTNSPLAVVNGINFLNVSTSSTATATISLINAGAASINLPVSIASTNVLNPAVAFITNAPAGGVTVPPNNADSPVQFIVTFSPGQVGQASANLMIGTNAYPLVGTGVVIADIDALQITYVDSTGVQTSPQAATPISFGNPAEGSNAVLKFTIANPLTSFNAVSLSTISVTGNGFSATGLPAMPFAIQPGTSISFTVTFAPPQSGTFTGSLLIGTRVFGLTGIGANLPIPSASLVFDTSTFTSQQQPHISVEFSSPSTITAIGTLTMEFTSSVNGVQYDPAVEFLATSGQNLQVTVAQGATAATYNGQSELTFQTGTTAGTILFTLTFPDSQPITKQITIVPAAVQITQMTAVAQDPYLVVTMTGFDNTYSTGPMSFNFYDTKGNVIVSNMAVNATSNFQQYFSTTASGGAFSIQLSFPVTAGSTASVGSVSATMSNSVGPSALTQQNF
ncbi:MAG: choice-of-anchor D domain-containing protein [Bryobacteraceae bacterium]